MKIEVPPAVLAEHEALHQRLAEAAREPGAVGETAREVERLLHPHLHREEEFALPPLGLLAEIAKHGVTGEMADVLPMTRRLHKELKFMLNDHRDIVAALDRLVAAAREEGKPRYERFAQALIAHARMEEQVLYPAAVLVGKLVEHKLGGTRLIDPALGHAA